MEYKQYKHITSGQTDRSKVRKHFRAKGRNLGQKSRAEIRAQLVSDSCSAQALGSTLPSEGCKVMQSIRDPVSESASELMGIGLAAVCACAMCSGVKLAEIHVRQLAECCAQPDHNISNW